MLAWVAGQSILVIALIAFAWCYVMAAVIYGAVVAAVRRGHASVLKASSPVTLTPLAVIFGLLVGFLAADVWPSFERARPIVAQEAGALRQASILADALPDDERSLVRAGLQQYVSYAVKDEWPAMAAGSQGLRTSTNGLETVAASLLTRQLTGANRLEEHIAL